MRKEITTTDGAVHCNGVGLSIVLTFNIDGEEEGQC